jgi:hypothetical protein
MRDLCMYECIYVLMLCIYLRKCISLQLQISFCSHFTCKFFCECCVATYCNTFTWFKHNESGIYSIWSWNVLRYKITDIFAIFWYFCLLFRNRESSVDMAKGSTEFDFWQGKPIFLYSAASSYSLEPTQALIQWIPGLFSPE